jgi:multidrug transporter EmrE-like cation transporter
LALAVYTILYAILATAGLILLRVSLDGATVTDALRTPLVYVGGLCYAASFGTFLMSLRRFEVLTVFPVFTGAAYASVALVASGVLGEPVTPVRIGGLALVGTGIVLLVR